MVIFSGNRSQLSQMAGDSLTPAKQCPAPAQSPCSSPVFHHLHPSVDNRKILGRIGVEKIAPMERKDGVGKIPDRYGGKLLPGNRGKATFRMKLPHSQVHCS